MTRRGENKGKLRRTAPASTASRTFASAFLLGKDDANAAAAVAPPAAAHPPFDFESAVHWLERDPLPRLVVDRRLEILWSNAAARIFLAPPMPLFVQDGRLCFSDEADPVRCRELIRAADGQRRRLALISRDGERCNMFDVWAAGAGPDDPVFVKAAVGQPLMDLEAAGLSEQYGLTRAETAVAQHFVALKTPAQIAEELGVSVHTVRSHIRRIYAKLSIRSQAQFMRIAYAFSWA